MRQLVVLILLELSRGVQTNLHRFAYQNAHRDQSEL